MTPLMVLQMVVVVVGTAWCMALASTAFFGGWYAQTHPTTGNDRVMRRLARLLSSTYRFRRSKKGKRGDLLQVMQLSILLRRKLV
jgi:hypothetical protein